MYYEDLSPFPSSGPVKLIAVGWLEAGHPIPAGDVNETVFSRLCELLVNPWMPCVAMGRHACQFCRFTGGPGGVTWRNTQFPIGVADLYVPSDGAIYRAPSSIVHYIDAHGYAPPEVFQRAVLACPPMRSMQYMKAILAAGGGVLVRGG